MTRLDRFIHALLLALFFCFCAFAFANVASAQAAPALTFTMKASSLDGASVIPALTWSTSPAASSCTASGDWTGTKAASGTETLAAVSASKAYTLTCTWPGDTTATVTWANPTLNTDGTPLTDLAGTRILYGNSASALTQTFYNENPTATSWTSPALAAGTWFFGVKAYNKVGVESAMLGPVSKTITAATNQSRTLTLGFKVPATGTNLAVQ